MQGMGFALLASGQRLWNQALLKAFGKPTHCRACGRALIFSPTPGMFQPDPFYMCPKASPAMGAHIIRGCVVVECDF